MAQLPRQGRIVRDDVGVSRDSPENRQTPGMSAILHGLL
jgi:hypothetical protein